MEGKGFQVRHGGKTHGKLFIGGILQLQGFGGGGDFGAGDGGEVVHLPFGMLPLQLPQQHELPAGGAVYPGQVRQVAQKLHILPAQSLQGDRFGIRGVIHSGNGDGVAHFNVGVALIQRFQSGVVGAALGIDGFQLWKIHQYVQIAFLQAGDGEFLDGAVVVAVLEGNAPENLGARHFPDQGIVALRGDGLAAQVQLLPVSGEQLPVLHHIVFCYEVTGNQDHSQGNCQNGGCDGAGQTFSIHGWFSFSGLSMKHIMHFSAQ